MPHDYTGNELYLKELNRNKHGAFKYALMVFSWILVLFSIAGMVEV